MPVNLDKPHLWKKDTQQSVDEYNRWFLEYAPVTYRQTRIQTTIYVENILQRTDNLRLINNELLIENPDILEMLRMSTCPPMARDRLIGLAQVSKSLVENMERNKRISPNLSLESTYEQIDRILSVLTQLIDREIFTWLGREMPPSQDEIGRASILIADRLCGMLADPLIRNAQEQRQLQRISRWLEMHGYVETESRDMHTIRAGTFAHRINIPIIQETGLRVNLPIDTVVMPQSALQGDIPLLIEAKSAGDFTNTNKRRKEEATKIRQIQRTFGDRARFILLLGGYFDSGYLGYEAAEGIDWIWEHRLDDLLEFGL